VQQFPASRESHFSLSGRHAGSRPGDRGLRIELRTVALLLPAGDHAEKRDGPGAESWTAGTAYAALLHDIGKIRCPNLHWFEYAMALSGIPGTVSVAAGIIRFRYRKDREYRLHGRVATGLLYTPASGPREFFDWLKTASPICGLPAVRPGRPVRAPASLAEFVVQPPTRPPSPGTRRRPNKAAGRTQDALANASCSTALRYLLKEEFKLNQPQASDGWLNPGRALRW